MMFVILSPSPVILTLSETKGKNLAFWLSTAKEWPTDWGFRWRNWEKQHRVLLAPRPKCKRQNEPRPSVDGSE